MQVCDGNRGQIQTTQHDALIKAVVAVPQVLDIPLLERAASVWFNLYVNEFSTTYNVWGLVVKQSTVPDSLAPVVDAVSLAFFARQFDYAPALPLAREKYSKALTSLRNSIESQPNGISDQTLLAMFLLDLFEKFTNHDPTPAPLWMGHVAGGVSLVSLRDRKGLQRSDSFALATQLSSNFLVSCMTAAQRVPPALAQLRLTLSQFFDTGDPRWKMSCVLVEICNLRAAVKEHDLPGIEIASRFNSLDQQAKALMEHFPLDWKPERHMIEEPSERILEMHYDTYPSHSVAQGMLLFSVTRVFLNHMIQEHSELDVAPFRPHSVGPAETIEQIARVVCAALPPYTTISRSDRARGDVMILRQMQCYTFIFTLYCVGFYLDHASPIRTWVIKQLHFMSNDLSVRNARKVAEMLEAGDDTDPWALQNMLGSYGFLA